MFEPYSFDTDTCQELLEELCQLDIKISVPSYVIPDEVHNLMGQPFPLDITEGPWPYSPRPENWAS
ncbi:MAG: hypothetical protein Q7T05_08530 [Dehalococcoidia bacterium]|nr:hypothetical protein [Dehalococcoidia bacterium]